MATGAMPDVIKAFLAWTAGRSLDDVKHLVGFGRPLFIRALRIPGWSHSIASTIKKAMKGYALYPERLDGVRVLVAFFRNETWRTYLIRCLRGRVENIDVLLKTFDVSFLKWRYETLAAVTAALYPLEVVRPFIREELFPHAQDRAQLLAVVNACKDDALWRWIRVEGTYVLGPLEIGRRWGLVCNHEECHKLRHDGQRHVHCVGNGRRLPQANSSWRL